METENINSPIMCSIKTMIDCLDFLVIQLVKLDEITPEDGRNFLVNINENKEFDLTSNIHEKTLELILFYTIFYRYSLFDRKFGVNDNEHLYNLCFSDVNKQMIFSTVKDDKIIEDNKIIKDIFEKQKASVSLDILSFYKSEVEDFAMKSDIRKYIIDYYNLDFELQNTVLIKFDEKEKHSEETKKLKKEYEMEKMRRIAFMETMESVISLYGEE